jgi:uncharacterized protein YkwD
MTPLNPLRRPRTLIALPVLLVLVLIVTARGAVSPDTARAGAYGYLLAPPTKCGGSRQTDTSLPTGDQEKIMQCLHNWARQRAGARGLYGSGLLYRSADGKTADMFRCRDFSHYACGRPMDYHQRRVGYLSGGCWGWGENIAWGTNRYGSPRAIMLSWLNSSPHRSNILKSSFRDLGLGVRKGTFRGYRNAQVWTAHFGYRC